MAAKEEAKTKRQNPEEEDSETESEPKPESSPFLDSDAEAEAGDENLPFSYTRSDGTVYRGYINDPITENTREANIARYSKFLDSESLRRMEEAREKARKTEEEIFNFPPDPENWKEEDLKELWADAPLSAIKPGWDPHFVDEDDVEIIHEEIEAGRDLPIAPFYLPYRRFYPVIPNNHHDINNPKAVIEELDRIEEFLIWVSYIFPDGSSYEGTVWDDLAHGKGVRVGEHGLVRYEGEWVRNEMEGHGVAEVEIPTMQPIPGSKLEAKMRAEGQIITRDFMSPEDREWLEMDIEDSVILANGKYEIPFYETDEWIREFGAKPEKGRYRYAGQWKHGRMHGCGVYEVNERTTYGRFYFGEFLEEPHGCDEEASALHAGIAEVAAAKARMFVNKPDGMVREDSGPYSDPQHPYFYEEEDVWMAPGFINQFYEVPDYWKMYVHEVDQEREMWLNSFYKAPLRIPMPSELEYWWWHKDEEPEFVLINKEPEPDPEDPSKLIYTEDPLILHTPTGRIINYVDDEEHGIRLFWQPELKEGEDIDPDKAEMLPLGFGEEEDVEDDTFRTSQEKGENAFESDKDRFNKWRDEKIKPWEMKVEILAKELELAEAELSLKVAIDELDEKLKLMEKEEENKVEEEVEGQDTLISEPVNQLEKTPPEAEEEEEEEEDEDDGNIPSSFGSIEDQKPANNNQQGSNSGKSTFAASSLSFAGSNLVSLVPQKLQNSFLRWKEGKFLKPSATAILLPTSELHHSLPKKQSSCTIAFPPAVGKSLKLKYARQIHHVVLERMPKLSLRNCSKRKSSVESGQLLEPFNILSLHTPVKM